MKNVLLFMSLLLLGGCSSNKIDRNKIAGSWYFVNYIDKHYSKSELDDLEKEMGNSPESGIRNFHYIFKADNTYEYKIYDVLINKGTYSLNHDNELTTIDTMESKKEILTIDYLDDMFLQVRGKGGESERISLYYKSDYKFPAVQTTEIK